MSISHDPYPSARPGFWPPILGLLAASLVISGCERISATFPCYPNWAWLAEGLFCAMLGWLAVRYWAIKYFKNVNKWNPRDDVPPQPPWSAVIITIVVVAIVIFLVWLLAASAAECRELHNGLRLVSWMVGLTLGALFRYMWQDRRKSV